MGAYLSEPVKEKVTEEGESAGFSWAATSMQGWRVNQEDAHNLIPDLDGKGTALFAVYDGHGGSEVSEYVAAHFPDFLKASKLWEAGDVGEALKQAFLDFDASLLTPDAVAELRKLAGQDMTTGEVDEPDEVAEERRMLFEEANMPIHQLVSKYGIPTELIGGLAAKVLNQSSDHSDDDDEADSANGTKTAKRKSNGSEASNDFKRQKKDGEGIGKSPMGSPHRQRSSKSESELRVLKAEDEAAGPISNWKAMGVGAKGAGKGEGEAGGRGTPETATAASSGDDEEKADEESDQDEDFKAPDGPDAPEDDDTTDSSEEDEESEDEAGEDGDEKEGGEEEVHLPMGDSPGVDSGTTACVAVLKDGVLVVANAGDSRCIVSRSGKAVELSIDHKPEDPVEKARVEKAGGRITPDGRVNGGLNLSRALGDHFYKRSKGLSLAEQMISPLPDIQRHKVEAEDEFVLLACDGIWNSLESQEVVDVVRKGLGEGRTAKEVVEGLCDRCLAPDSSGDGTGCDNMTVLLLLLRHPSSQADSQPPPNNSS